MGAFGPITALARDEDCFSVWYQWGASSIELSDFFYKAFDLQSAADWTKLSVKLALYIIESYSVVSVCIDELKWNKANPWTDKFDFLAIN